MARHWCLRLLIAAVLVPLLVVACDRSQATYWVGSTDLKVEFAASDADTGSPIPGARVEVKSEGGFYEERGKQEFVLSSGADGIARKECRQCMCFGAQSGLKITNTFAVHLPWWHFRLVADGYEPGEWTELSVPKYIQQAQRAGPGEAKLVVSLSLRRTMPKSD